MPDDKNIDITLEMITKEHEQEYLKKMAHNCLRFNPENLLFDNPEEQFIIIKDCAICPRKNFCFDEIKKRMVIH